MISFNEPIFQSHKESLKEISCDNRSAINVYMTILANEAVNFDDVKTEYLNSKGFSNECLKSCDGLYSYDFGHIMIEFKNGQVGGNTQKEIRIKIADSLLILSDIKKLHIVDASKNEIEFILVYNEEENSDRIEDSLREIHKHIGVLSNTEIIYFGLKRYKGVYFKNVHTYTVKEFENYINNL